MFMCLFANSNRSKKQKAFKIGDFFPFSMPEVKKNLIPAQITDLKFMLKNGVK